MVDAQRRELLRIARTAILNELSGGKIEPVPTKEAFSASFGGAFVTLRRGDRLRGCMGTFHPRPSLAETVEEAARLACKDPRFARMPVTIEEMSDIRIEVSVLGHLERSEHPAALEVGRHGILIRRGNASGCFLPQVATDHGWDAEQFLDQCCSMKCGLPAGAWREPDTEVHLFTAEIITE